MSRKHAPARKGITLILAIMIMSAVVAIGITLSTVLVYQVRINKVVKEGHQGYYATESGMELGLNTLNTLKSGPLSVALTALQNSYLPAANTDAENTPYFCPGGTCNASASLLTASTQVGSVASTQQVVKENQSVFVELYNVDNSLNVSNPPTLIPADFSAPALCVYAEGLDTDGAGADTAGNEVFEVSWVAWSTALNLSRTQKILVSYSSFSSAADCAVPGTTDRGFSVPITQFYPAFSGTFAGFRVRITPLSLKTAADPTLNGDVANLEVYTSPSVTSQIQLKSVSTAAGQKQALAALFPWSLPLSGLFDFVIFSEQEITKNVPIQIANDLRRYGPYAAAEGAQSISPTTAFTDPDPDCSNASPCAYYVRLISDSDGWEETNLTVSAGDTAAQSIGALNATSCIIRNPYTFTTGYTITFTNKPVVARALDKYELLTRPAFSTADEGYCP